MLRKVRKLGKAIWSKCRKMVEFAQKGKWKVLNNSILTIKSGYHITIVTIIKGLFTHCDLSCRFVGPEKSWSKSARVNGDPMCARFQSDMSADLEKNLWSLHRFYRVGADFTAQAYVSLRKMADVESKSVRKKRSFDEKEINLLILLGLACLSERYRDSKITSETTLVLWYKYFLYLLQLTTLVVTSSLDSNSPQLLVSHTYL